MLLRHPHYLLRPIGAHLLPRPPLVLPIRRRLECSSCTTVSPTYTASGARVSGAGHRAYDRVRDVRTGGPPVPWCIRSVEHRGRGDPGTSGEAYCTVTDGSTASARRSNARAESLHDHYRYAAVTTLGFLC